LGYDSTKEQLIKDDFRRRMMMFESMILMYVAEMWGWKEQEEVERVQENI
jgi:hypothetical protein